MNEAGLFEGLDEEGPIRAARTAGNQIKIATQDAVDHGLLAFLMNASTRKEMLARAATPEFQEAVQRIASTRMPSVSDPVAKLARSIRRRWGAEQTKGFVLVAETQRQSAACPSCPGPECYRCGGGGTLFRTIQTGGLKLARDWPEEKREKAEEKGDTYDGTDTFPIENCGDVRAAYKRLHQTNENKSSVKHYIDGKNEELGCGIDSDAKTSSVEAGDADPFVRSTSVEKTAAHRVVVEPHESGKGDSDEDGYVAVCKTPGCDWLGTLRAGREYAEDDAEEHRQHREAHKSPEHEGEIPETCPQCHEQIPEDWERGYCPYCADDFESGRRRSGQYEASKTATNPAFPGGQCPACGTGLDEEGYCTDPGCSNVGKQMGEPGAPRGRHPSIRCPDCGNSVDEDGYCTEPGCPNEGKTASKTSSLTKEALDRKDLEACVGYSRAGTSSAYNPNTSYEDLPDVCYGCGWPEAAHKRSLDAEHGRRSPKSGSLTKEAPGGPHPGYKIVERNGEFAVINRLGEVKHTFKTHAEAREYQKALYVNVPGASEEEASEKGKPFPKAHEAARVNPGQRVTIAEGSGIDSGKSGVVIPLSRIPTNAFGVAQIEGEYRPLSDYKDHVGVRFDDGRMSHWHPNRLQVVGAVKTGEATALDRDDPARAGRFRHDVLGLGENVWTPNSMTYDTHEEAAQAGQNLYGRWMGMEAGRVVPADAPYREPYTGKEELVAGSHRRTSKIAYKDTPTDERGKPTEELPKCRRCGTDIFVTDHIPYHYNANGWPAGQREDHRPEFPEGWFTGPRAYGAVRVSPEDYNRAAEETGGFYTCRGCGKKMPKAMMDVMGGDPTLCTTCLREGRGQRQDVETMPEPASDLQEGTYHPAAADLRAPNAQNAKPEERGGDLQDVEELPYMEEAVDEWQEGDPGRLPGALHDPLNPQGGPQSELGAGLIAPLKSAAGHTLIGDDWVKVSEYSGGACPTCGAGDGDHDDNCRRCHGDLHWDPQDEVWADDSHSMLCGGNQPHDPMIHKTSVKERIGSGEGPGYSDELGDRECLDAARGNCEGPVEYREALSGTGRNFPRCEKHWGDRLEEHQRSLMRYPDSDVPPRWFDPGAAGERWDEDY